MSDQPKLSPVEGIKRESHYLAGTLFQELHQEADHFSKDNETLLKFHGTYQQDDRDSRKAAHKEGKGKAFMFMVRTKIPAGRLTSQQLLTELDLCDQLGNTTLRCTTRQGLQLHGVVKSNLGETIRRINEAQLSTLGACGDVNRNVMCCPAPLRQNGVREEMQKLADQIAAELAPRSKAYFSTWMRDLSTGQEELVGGVDERAADEGDPALNGFDIEPIYGKVYLPRKFKIALGLCDDNCVDIYTNDLGLLAIVRDNKIIGYNLIPGGGQGTSPSAKKTFPALGKRMAFVTPDQVLAATVAVVKAQRDLGNREDRKVARLKYVIANLGLEAFKDKVEEHFGAKLPEPHPDDVYGFDDHMGWHDQGDGKSFYGLNIENGRIADNEHHTMKAALREVCHEFNPAIRLTSHQSMLLCDIDPAKKQNVEAIFKKHGVKLTEEVSTVRRWSMACVAWPTCGLSITEAERALPSLIDKLEVELARLGLDSDRFTVRMTGCPNGCARPYNSDIGLVGRAAGKYSIALGGQLLGTRLNFLYKDMVLEDDVVPELVPVFIYYKQERQPEETFGDFCHRKGKEDLLAWSEQYQATAKA